MRSFAVIAGFAAAANAYAYGYPPANTTTPVYEVSPTPEYPAYPEETSKTPEYPAYPEETPAYPVETPSYPVYTTTSVVYGLTTVCPEPTTVTYGTKVYTVKSSTTIIDDECEYTTTYEVKPTPKTYPVYTPVYSKPVVAYPSKNVTVPHPTGYPTKPSVPEFTGAAAQAGVGVMAVLGAVAAFL